MELEIKRVAKKLIKTSVILLGLTLSHQVFADPVSHEVCYDVVETGIPFPQCQAIVDIHNQLIDTPKKVTNHRPIRRLGWFRENLDMNSFTGVTVENNTVVQIVLDDSSLSGIMPETLGQLVDLEVLSMMNNSIKGSLPTSIGEISTLKKLELANNHISGSIPSEFSQLHNLISLNLRENNLSGSIPFTQLGGMYS
jgi:Leucine-rich repeat (LRR) protein